MANLKTTILGWAALAGAVIDFAAALLGGGDLNLTWTQVGTAAAGVGLIFAKDAKSGD
jgi:hypothetical protein